MILRSDGQEKYLKNSKPALPILFSALVNLIGIPSVVDLWSNYLFRIASTLSNPPWNREVTKGKEQA